MTASEFAFLALGLVLGVASGAALSIVIRARPPAPREIRVTVAPGAVPVRPSATLQGLITPGSAEASDVAAESPIMAGVGAAGASAIVRQDGPGEGDRGSMGTPVRIVTGESGQEQAVGPVGAPARTPVAVAIRPEPDQLIAAFSRPEPVLVASRPRAAGPGSARPVVDPDVPGGGARVVAGGALAATAVAVLERPEPAASGAVDPDLAAVPATGLGAGGPDRPPTASGAGDADRGADPDGPNDTSGHGLDARNGVDACADERRTAQERCALADRLREASDVAAGRLRETQLAFDAHEDRATRAAAEADPRAVRAAKELALATFRAADSGATSREAVELAARDWLLEIDRINRVARESAATAAREHEAAAALVAIHERLSLEADVARINAEAAAEACLHAREALAACEEAESHRGPGMPGPGTGGEGEAGETPTEDVGRVVLVGGPELEPRELTLDEDAPKRVFGDHEPAILKLLHGDRDAMTRIVTSLAGDDPAERRRWQLGIAGLVEAIVARAIEAAALEFPFDHPFWGPFSQAQCRDIATALASFGYRFDGLGGFLDERVPSQRDLSLAIGYAGLDPMRMRHWPTEKEMPELYRDVAVAADEFIAGAAPGLTLGEMIAVLRGRAEELTDLWNAWGRLRPLLLQP